MDKINFISGVELTPLKKIEHPLGDVLHGMKSSDKGFAGFQEAYFSTIKCGVIKPWKKHLQMTLNLIVPIGEIRFVLFDDRKGSMTKNQFMEMKLSIDNYYRLTVPPGIWMGFKGESDSTNLLLNIADLKHDPLEIVRADLNKFNYAW
jgi:dTDP-4-dehydrorhamnose 3,5-epimerase